MGKSVFDLVTEHLTNERLDGIILQNPKYEKTMEEVDRLAEDLKGLDLSAEETKAVNRLIYAYLAQNFCYSDLAYRQGFKDCASLLAEMGILKLPGDYNG